MFDTFEGFAEQDILLEEKNFFSNEKVGHFHETSIELVMEKMLYPKQCRIHKGYFPDTAKEIDSIFCFVNLDMDLYLPIYKGLHFFAKKMTNNGVILVHDYYSSGYKGAKAAVETFLDECKGTIQKYPIGDNASIMLVGKWNEITL